MRNYFKLIPSLFRNRKILFTCSVVLICIYVFLDNQFYQRHSGKPTVLGSEQIHPIIYTYLAEQVPPEKYLIDTEGCKITQTLIIPNYYKSNWRVEKIPDCDYESSLATLDDQNQILRLNPGFENLQCCFHEILRVAPDQDNGFRLTDCQVFEKEINVTGVELFVTKCGNALNYEANFPAFPQVQEKVNYWTNKAATTEPDSDSGPDEPVNRGQEAEPYNVLIIGIDTTSRSQIMRSLPRTIAQLLQMGFVDFKGYFAPAGFTEGYFMNFLLGLSFNESRTVCKPNWTVPWDDCPFIWKEFNASGYITMYMEDGHQTFNWGGQSGFARRPTDYYAHQLFTAMEDMRQEHSGVWNVGNKLDMYAYCASNETVPQFVLRYLSRFIHKYHTSPAPFFTFTWFENPYHDFEYSLGNMDSHFYSFFQSLSALPRILDRTLIVLMSDHGDRVSLFQETPEGPQERYLPPFYIRLPNKLAARHPEFVEALDWNRNHLTTPFDAHQTMLHILDMSKSTSKSDISSDDSNPTFKFSPVQSDRSSLFFRVAENRSCDYISDTVRHCVCSTGTALKEESISNQHVLTELIAYATNELNLVVQKSGYADVCEIWSSNVKSIISARITDQDQDGSSVFLQFLADPGPARFEVKIKLVYADKERSSVDRFEMMSTFSRISSYGKQSHCVRFETDLDKLMKEFCYCK